MTWRWLLVLVVGVMVGVGELSAQWFTYPNPAVPRVGGKPNLLAPTPRMADG